jgi:hypothetical protein
MVIFLQPIRNPLLSQRCYHISGRGGLKGAVRHVQSGLRPGQFFFRSDVSSYYASLTMKLIASNLQQ